MQGDIIAIVRGNKLVAEYEYDAWGNCTILRNTDNIANTNPLRYRGYYYDTDTGLYYLQSRYYDSNIGRFINADDSNLLLNNVYNLYAYCENNPVIGMDPSGYYNIKNFNCYSYAVGYSGGWLNPGYKSNTRLGYYYTVNQIAKLVLNDYKGKIRKIKNQRSKIKSGEYRIALRVCTYPNVYPKGFIGPPIYITYDYHFWKQDPKTLKWWDKPGKTAIRCLGKVNPENKKNWYLTTQLYNTRFYELGRPLKSRMLYGRKVWYRDLYYNSKVIYFAIKSKFWSR